MSHFSVLVTGDDIAAQLQPYHEFECTGIDDEYVQNVDITDEICGDIVDGTSLSEALEDHGFKPPWLSNAGQHRAEEHKYRFAIVRDGKLVQAFRRTNPNKKWDWWKVGGRWAHHLLDRSGMPCSTTTKAELNVLAMQRRALRDELARWRLASQAIQGEPFDSWETVRERHKGDIEHAREAYFSQPPVVRFRQARDASLLFGFRDLAEEFTSSRDEYIERVKLRALRTFAVLHEGVWHEQGRMGWWGAVHDEKPADSWEVWFNEFLESLAGNTRLTVVDCHT